MRLLKIFGAGFSMSLRRELSFRSNLLADFLVSLLQIGSALAVVQIVFGQTDYLLGWGKAQMLVLIGTFELVSGLRWAFIEPNLGWFPGAIRDGRLDVVLLQPPSSLFLASFGRIAPMALLQPTLGLGVVVLGMTQSGASLQGFATWVLLVTLGIVAAWAFRVLVACMAFWAPRLELDIFIDAVWQFGRYPVDIYQRAVRFVLTYIFPMALVSSMPAKALMGEPDPNVLLTAALVAGIATLLAMGAWTLGLRRYAGATS